MLKYESGDLRRKKETERKQREYIYEHPEGVYMRRPVVGLLEREWWDPTK
jgi:hypothetical protein